MKLECAQSGSTANATVSDIRNALADDASRGEFIILLDSDLTYIQAANVSDGPFTLEYQEGDTSHHFQCTRDLTKSEVESAFLKYLTRDPSWKSDFPWQQETLKPWWKFW